MTTSDTSSLTAGIVGASGFTGAELLRLIEGHTHIDATVLVGDTQAGRAVDDLYPSLAVSHAGRVYVEYDPADLIGLDVVFLCLPHMASQPVVADLWGKVGLIVDLGSDFRLVDAALYPTWYGAEHQQPELLGEFVYGLAERNRTQLAKAKAIAVPGCYPTAAALAIAPFADAGLVEPHGVIVDAASGVSGAGRGLRENTTFAAVHEDFCAYGLLGHRHTPEIEQVTRCEVLFTPHLAPMVRGILTTCYMRPASGASCSGDAALDVLADAYRDEPFVVVTNEPPHTKATVGANTAQLTARFDERTGWLVSICAIDNLMKGASGSALQCANIALGLDETEGLPLVGLGP